MLLLLACVVDEPAAPIAPARTRFVDVRGTPEGWLLRAEVDWQTVPDGPPGWGNHDCGEVGETAGEEPLDPVAARAAPYVGQALPAWSGDLELLRALPGDHVQLSPAEIGDDCEAQGFPELDQHVEELDAALQASQDEGRDCVLAVGAAWCEAGDALDALEPVEFCEGLEFAEPAEPLGPHPDVPRWACRVCEAAVEGAHAELARLDLELADCRRREALLLELADALLALAEDGSCVDEGQVSRWRATADRTLAAAELADLQAERRVGLARDALAACEPEALRTRCEGCSAELGAKPNGPVSLGGGETVATEQERLAQGLLGAGAESAGAAVRELTPQQIHGVLLQTEAPFDDALAVLGEDQLVLIHWLAADSPDPASHDLEADPLALSEALELLGALAKE